MAHAAAERVAQDAYRAIGVSQWSRFLILERKVISQVGKIAADLRLDSVEQRELGPATIHHVQPVGFPITFRRRPLVMFATAVGSHIDAGGNVGIDFESRV